MGSAWNNYQQKRILNYKYKIIYIDNQSEFGYANITWTNSFGTHKHTFQNHLKHEDDIGYSVCEINKKAFFNKR